MPKSSFLSMSPSSLSRFSFSFFYDHGYYTIANTILQEYGEYRLGHDFDFHDDADGDHQGTKKRQQHHQRRVRSSKRILQEGPEPRQQHQMQHQETTTTTRTTTQRRLLVPILSTSPIYSSPSSSTSKSTTSSPLPSLVSSEDVCSSSSPSSSSSSSTSFEQLYYPNEGSTSPTSWKPRRGNSKKSVRFQPGTEFPQTTRGKKVKRNNNGVHCRRSGNGSGNGKRDEPNNHNNNNDRNSSSAPPSSSTTTVIAVSKFELHRPKPILVESPPYTNHVTVTDIHNNEGLLDAPTLKHPTTTTRRRDHHHGHHHSSISNNYPILVTPTRSKETYMTRTAEGYYVMKSR